MVSNSMHLTRGEIVVLHGMLACVAFVPLLPLGGIFIRTLNGKHTLRIHSAVQMVAVLSYLTALALGIYLRSPSDFVGTLETNP
jgi:hypothetical protein